MPDNMDYIRIWVFLVFVTLTGLLIHGEINHSTEMKAISKCYQSARTNE